MSINELLRTCAVDLLDSEQHVTIELVIDCAMGQDPEAFQAETDALIRQAARRIVKTQMAHLTNDDSAQGQLPGIVGLPSAIAIPTLSGVYYVRSDKATWDELVRGRDVRVHNVVSAQAKLDAYDDALEDLRPLMEGTALTVAEATKIRSAS